MPDAASDWRSLLRTPITLVDIGADGGTRELPSLAGLCEVHAVEPREDSFQELESRTTAVQSCAYRKTTNYNVGIAGKAGPHDLYVTTIPQASSLLEPDTDLVRRWRGDGGFDVVVKVQVDCITLGDLAERAGLTAIDYIKLDTQGCELDILLGAPELLPRISVIYSEVEFVQLYKNQPLFDDFVCRLRPYGFRFVGFTEHKTRDDNPMGKKIWAEAVFVNETLAQNSEAVLKAGLALMDLGFVDDGKWLLWDAGFDQSVIDGAARDLAKASGGKANSLAISLVTALQSVNAKLRARSLPEMNFSLAKRLLARSSWGRRLVSLVSREIGR
ncbi:MAG: FkbM family methyltransferase [Rhodospirillales bacterium]|tara:strand:- start:1300 stop:2289 length:990 start_codon:yes stop_codon:yes gene_type:complete